MTLSLSPAAEVFLLGVARRAAEIATTGGCVDSVCVDHATVVNGEGAAGAFVSLHKRGSRELRGCIGYVPAPWPLVETVARAAEGAVSRDPRFEPVHSAELAGVALEISVLGKPYPITPEAVVIGRHGLILDSGAAQGLLLPQVPVEWGWDRTAYLEQLAKKAGLPAGSWRQPGVRLSAFEAVVLQER